MAIYVLKGANMVLSHITIRSYLEAAFQLTISLVKILVFINIHYPPTNMHQGSAGIGRQPFQAILLYALFRCKSTYSHPMHSLFTDSALFI